MFLPVIFYNLNREERLDILQKLSPVSFKKKILLRVQMYTDNISDACSTIPMLKDIHLILIGVDSLQADKNLLSIRLGRLALKSNRDHYVIYVIKNPNELKNIVPFCALSSGVLTAPIRDEDIEHIFIPIFEDYHLLGGASQQESAPFLMLRSEGRMYRVRTSDICVVEASNKTLKYHTIDQTITVYETLENAWKTLGDSFIRCHRSYIVNPDHIQLIDFSKLDIYMTNGMKIPISRSSKEIVHHRFQNHEELVDQEVT